VPRFVDIHGYEQQRTKVRLTAELKNIYGLITGFPTEIRAFRRTLHTTEHELLERSLKAHACESDLSSLSSAVDNRG
jgi:hypothetical protein